jgi:hypothetical protein
MIRHVTVFRWVPEATDEARRLVAERLAALPPLMTGMPRFTIGSDLGLVEGNADFAVVADFEDAAAYFRYRDHPAHQEIIRHVTGPITRERHTVQMTL